MSNLKEIQSKCNKEFNTLKDELDVLKAEWRKKAKIVFKVAFESFFNEHPEVKLVVWDQYTPFFNDGDPCEFSIGETFYVKEMKDEDGDDVELFGSSYEYDAEVQCWSTWSSDVGGENFAGEELRSSIKSIDSLLTNLEDFLQSTFGDHKTIVIYPEDIEIRDYHHD